MYLEFLHQPSDIGNRDLHSAWGNLMEDFQQVLWFRKSLFPVQPRMLQRQSVFSHLLISLQLVGQRIEKVFELSGQGHV
jgi:hypothetical protein